MIRLAVQFRSFQGPAASDGHAVLVFVDVRPHGFQLTGHHCKTVRFLHPQFGCTADPAFAIAETGGNAEDRHFIHQAGHDLVAEVERLQGTMGHPQVTDGFTGNVTLKTLEGAMRAIMSRLLMALDTDDDTRTAGAALGPALDTMVSELHPDSVGGALLLGVKGVCVISHGSSSPDAMVNAIRVASEMVEVEMVDHLTTAAASAAG